MLIKLKRKKSAKKVQIDLDRTKNQKKRKFAVCAAPPFKNIFIWRLQLIIILISLFAGYFIIILMYYNNLKSI